MSNILNLQVKDESLKDIVYNNPYYIDIKGSVNICLIRCGQEIDSCQSITFSTMTNYGKILVLNPNNSKIGKCAIKLAYDTSNDNKDNNGNANYQFVKAFVTVPSLHRLNGQIYDMETFLIFSSVQKNGNILYVVLCTLSNGTQNVPQTNDPTLLNYKLMTELFTNNNIVPEIYGTKEISGVPNPVDLSSFIPPLGLRSFYDYTHPLNNKVNFRVFQKVMNVRNDILTNLRSKLTPGLIYDNFKSSILKTINPFEGLFFYFSEDLTNRYKSFEINNKKEKFESNISTDEKKKDEQNLEEISKNIIEEQEKYENDEFKKIDIKDKEISEFDKIEEEEIKKSEKFVDKKKEDGYKKNIIMIYSTIICLFLYNILNTYFVNNLFSSQIKPSNENLALSIVNLGDHNISALLGTKFKMYIILFIHGVFTFLCFFISMILLSTNNILLSNILITIIVFILIIGIIVFYLHIRYIFYRLKTISDNSLTYKVNFLFTYICNKMFSSNNISTIFNNLYNIFLTENYNNFNIPMDENNTIVINNVMKGGGIDNNEIIVEKFNSVPAPYINEDKNLLNAKYMEKVNKTNSFMDLLDLFSDDYFKDKLSSNSNWFRDTIIYTLFLILSFIFIVSRFQYDYLMTNNYNIGLNTVTNLAVVIFTYKGLLLLFSAMAYYFTTNKILLYIILGVIVLGMLSSIITGFIPIFPGNNKTIKIPFYLYICFVGVALLLISSLFIINLFNKKPEAIPEGGNKQLEQSQINESESYNLFSNHISPKISDRNKQLLTNIVNNNIETIDNITYDKISNNNNNNNNKKKQYIAKTIQKILTNKNNNIKRDHLNDIKKIIQIKYPELKINNINTIDKLKNIGTNDEKEFINNLIELLNKESNVIKNEKNEEEKINELIYQNHSNESLKEFLTCIKGIIEKLKEINNEKNKARKDTLLIELKELKKNINSNILNKILQNNSDVGTQISGIYNKVIEGITKVIPE